MTKNKNKLNQQKTLINILSKKLFILVQIRLIMNLTKHIKNSLKLHVTYVTYPFK